MTREALAALFAQVIGTTLGAWRGTVDLDLVVVFDVRGRGLCCFVVVAWGPDEVCPRGSGRDCFGAFEVQRGFSGFVEDAGVEVRRMQPSLAVWRGSGTPAAPDRPGRRVPVAGCSLDEENPPCPFHEPFRHRQA